MILGNELADSVIEEMIINPQNELTREIQLDHCYLEIVGSFIKRNFMKSVYCLYLRDDTVQQKLNKLNQKYQEDLKQKVEEKTEKIGNA